jgi:hypothetical protein
VHRPLHFSKRSSQALTQVGESVQVTLLQRFKQASWREAQFSAQPALAGPVKEITVRKTSGAVIAISWTMRFIFVDEPPT